jgi:hypothetical protein
MIIINGLCDEFWVEREFALEAVRPAMIEFVLEEDLLWDPDPRTVEFEIEWDKARLDALSVLEDAIMRGETDIDAHEIAVRTAEHIDADHRSDYISDRYATPAGIVAEDNEWMLRGLAWAERLRAVRRESNLQREIANELRLFQRIDLSIPAQRRVANRLRAEFGFPHLAEITSGAEATK